ncbi:hypothetical protein [Rhizobium leguminosarum]|uniref:hypothetical protein n=1 Tax=Rhizobium leguminosarum TaxID=384 RepID=UPI0013F16ED8|nr:hypothetical protein [Rhizobium leguminosarum]MBB4326559.1 hypothetical protein [Rhizobium leguminosarum]MBB4352151.1 hypothetical protein [Rhizobium leguminosarum]MBB4546799.1 hypothetical protein [Rhizobium leguminosarum]MBB4559144.1 hypothetical protein [Rhizobium leguminosarum]
MAAFLQVRGFKLLNYLIYAATSGPTTFSRVLRRAARIAGFPWSTGRRLYIASCPAYFTGNERCFQTLSEPLDWSLLHDAELLLPWNA